MELFTMDRSFQKQNVIDQYESLIWTERYYGDSEFELVVPKTKEMANLLAPGMYLGIEESEEVMSIETIDIQKTTIKFTGISLMSWMNNRFVRTTPWAEDQSYQLEGLSPGEALFTLMQSFIGETSPYLDGTIDIGIENPERFIIPEILLAPGSWYDSGENLTFVVNFGPLYDTMRKVIAEPYRYGIQILRNPEPNDKPLRFRVYKGTDHTSVAEGFAPVIRFSEKQESLTEVEEVKSISTLKTMAVSFATDIPSMSGGGEAALDPDASGFDLRATMVFATQVVDPPSDGVYPDFDTVKANLITLSYEELRSNSVIHAVGGTAIATPEHIYGVDYYLGDIVEMEGFTGFISKARVTEYIRTQDGSGEKRAPTLVIIDDTEIDTTPPEAFVTTLYPYVNVSPKVDVLVAQDLTGSMEHSTWDDVFAGYISSVSGTLMDQLTAAGVDLRVGVVQYKDYCRQNVANGGPGPPYVDCGCTGGSEGNPNTYESKDYPEYIVRQAMTSTKSLITAGLIAGEISGPSSGGGDIAEALNLVFNKSYTDGAIGWRSDAKRVLLNHGDAEPHGAGTLGIVGCVDTSVDPHGLSTLTELAAMISNKIQLIMSLFRSGSVTTSATLTGYQGIAAAGYQGSAVTLGVTSGASTTFPPYSSTFLSAPILAGLAVADAHVEFDSAGPAPANETWVTTIPDPVTDYVGYGSRFLGPIVITAPAGTPPGTYEFLFRMVVDGVSVDTQTFNVFVP